MTKSSSLFAAIRPTESTKDEVYVKASCYVHDLTKSEDRNRDHVRLSLWSDNEAQLVISMPLDEARRLASFILEHTHGTNAPG